MTRTCFEFNQTSEASLCPGFSNTAVILAPDQQTFLFVLTREISRLIVGYMWVVFCPTQQALLATDPGYKLQVASGYWQRDTKSNNRKHMQSLFKL